MLLYHIVLRCLHRLGSRRGPPPRAVVKPKNDLEEMGQGTSHKAQGLLCIKFHGEHATSLYSLMVLKLHKYKPMKEGATLL